MWAYGRYGPGNSIVLYEYDPTRSSEVPKRLLLNYKGYLQADGYDGYNAVSSQDDIIRVGCMAHCRRKFVEAYEASVKGQGKAQEALLLIQSLYKIESEIREQTRDQKKQIRSEQSKPILEKFKLWLDRIHNTIPHESVLGKAISYALNEWKYLVRYIDDGQIEIDNNFIENQIRPFALGRKNWLFSQSVAGVKASANIYSIMQTAAANNIELFSYLKKLMKELPNSQTQAQLEALLPFADRQLTKK